MSTTVTPEMIARSQRIAAECKRIEQERMERSQREAAERMSTTICSNCGETTEDGHLFGDVCLRVTADDLPQFERTDRADWEG